MEVLFERCSGIDVHKKDIKVCIIISGKNEDSIEILLANAGHIKNVPGRKTDVKDCEWIGMLLRNGLHRGSFIPPRYIRQPRDILRHRSKLNNTIAAEKNRVGKYLEDANIKRSDGYIWGIRA